MTPALTAMKIWSHSSSKHQLLYHFSPCQDLFKSSCQPELQFDVNANMLNVMLTCMLVFFTA